MLSSQPRRLNFLLECLNTNRRHREAVQREASFTPTGSQIIKKTSQHIDADGVLTIISGQEWQLNWKILEKATWKLRNQRNEQLSKIKPTNKEWNKCAHILGHPASFYIKNSIDKKINAIQKTEMNPKQLEAIWHFLFAKESLYKSEWGINKSPKSFIHSKVHHLYFHSQHIWRRYIAQPLCNSETWRRTHAQVALLLWSGAENQLP